MTNDLVSRAKALRFPPHDEAADPYADLLEEAIAEIEQARRTAEYWKAEHLAGNIKIEQLREELNELQATDTSRLPYEKGWQDGRADAWTAYNAGSQVETSVEPGEFRNNLIDEIERRQAEKASCELCEMWSAYANSVERELKRRGVTIMPPRPSLNGRDENGV